MTPLDLGAGAGMTAGTLWPTLVQLLPVVAIAAVAIWLVRSTKAARLRDYEDETARLVRSNRGVETVRSEQHDRLGDFVPERDGHALVLGHPGIAIWRWIDQHHRQDGDCVVLAPWAGARPPRRGLVLVSNPRAWAEHLRATLAEVSCRRDRPGEQTTPIFVVVDIGSLLTEARSRRRRDVLALVDELVRTGQAASVHVLAIATDPAAGHRASSIVQNTARVFRAPRSRSGAC